MLYCFTLGAQIVLCSFVVYFALALYFTHQSCLLANQNAVTVLSVWTLSHWPWPSSTLSQGIPLFFLPRHKILWLLAWRRIWPVFTNTNVWTATRSLASTSIVSRLTLHLHLATFNYFMRWPPTCMFCRKQRFTWILATRILTSFLR